MTPPNAGNPKLDQAKTREDMVAAANVLRARADGTGKIGAVGFCYGGGIVNMLATRMPELNAGWPAFETALKENKKTYEVFFYPGTQHGFNNDITPRYDAEAAKLAWSRTVEFFRKHLA